MPILALDAAGDTTALGIVGHEHQIASGQGDEGGECGAFVAALLFLDLDEQLGAIGDGVLDAGAADIDTWLEVLTGNFFERQKTVAVFTVVDKAGFKAGLYPGNNALVDIALSLLASCNFNIKVDEPLAIDNRNPQLFGMGCVEKHSFHSDFSLHGPPVWGGAKYAPR